MMAKKAKFAVNDEVTFTGYSSEVAEAEQLLTEGEVYTVVDVNEAEGSLGIQLDNPSFNSKKKETEQNTRHIVVDVFFDEVELKAEGADDETPEEPEEEEAAPPAKTKAKAAPAKAAPAKAAPAAKGKVVAKAAPAAKGKAAPVAKGKAAPAAKGKLPAKKEEKEEVDESEALPALEQEDAEVLELIDGQDLLELAGELVNDAEALNYKLGGVLYHLRLGKAYQESDEKYAAVGGWKLFIEEQIPGLGYRKAMNLIDIYYGVNLYGIDPAKVQEIGWTKFSKIVPVMTEDNATDLVELAETSTVSVLSDTIRDSYKEVGGTPGEKKKKTIFKFRLWEDQAVGVTEVLQATMEAMSMKHLDDAFEHIIMEWAAEHPIEPKAAPAAKTTAKAAPAKVAPAKAAPAAKVRGRA